MIPSPDRLCRRAGIRSLVPLLAGLALAGCGGEEPVAVAPGVEAAPTLDDGGAARLAALGYVDWRDAPDPEKRGVTIHEPGAVPDELHLYTSRPRRFAHLIDRSGAIVHEWAIPEDPVSWHHVELAPGGDLYVITKDTALTRLDWDSNLRWRLPLPAHHDLALAGDGTAYVITRQRREIEHAGRTIPVVDDRIVEVSPDGDVRRSVSLFDRLRDRVPSSRLDAVAAQIAAGTNPDELGRDTPADVFHTNSIQLVPWEGATGPAALLSVRELNRLVVLDLGSGQVLWEWGDRILEAQHHATLQPDGTILVFDNGIEREWSRILRLDPRSGFHETVYSARGFYSERRGGVEELPRGHLLITESARGRIFEVDADGRVLWEFYNPDLTTSRSGKRKRAPVYRMTRVDPSLLPARLDGPGPGR